MSHNMFPLIVEINSLTMQIVLDGVWYFPSKGADLINELRKKGEMHCNAPRLSHRSYGASDHE